jgi:hypothetical protein
MKVADYLSKRSDERTVTLLIKRAAIRLAFLIFEVAVGIVLVLCMTGTEAKAYADPGSGAVLWQLLFATIVSIGFQFRKLRTWFTQRRPRRRTPVVE